MTLPITTHEMALQLAESIKWSPFLTSLFGRREMPVQVRELMSVPTLTIGGMAAPLTVEGFGLEWRFWKPDMVRGGLFRFSVHAFIPYAQMPGRALDVIFDAFRRFAEHELREGFWVDGVRVFDPHEQDGKIQGVTVLPPEVQQLVSGLGLSQPGPGMPYEQCNMRRGPFNNRCRLRAGTHGIYHDFPMSEAELTADREALLERERLEAEESDS